VEGLAELDEAPDLARAGRGHRAGEMPPVIRQHADRNAEQAGEPGDLPGTVAPAHLEERAAIDQRIDHLAHIEGTAPVGRHDRSQVLLAPVAIVGRVDDRRQFPDILREVAQEATDRGEGGLLVFHHIVDHAALLVHGGAAELFLGDGVAQRALDQRRAADQHL
jgi:hypothetical protein